MSFGDISVAIARLRPAFGERFSVSRAVRDQHGKYTTFHPTIAPDAVVCPQTATEVRQVMSVCAELRVPVIPFGTGTSCEGHVAALHGGICIDTSQLRAIRAIRPADLDATVEAGVTRKELNANLNGSGLHFPIDPGADASIGGQGLPTDVCVPISDLAANIEAARADVVEAGLIAPICGHVGDGNFHLCFVVDPSDAQEMRRVEEVNKRMVERALACGGTCTGEHGIGYGKIDFLRKESGAAFALHQAVKRALDPAGIMNPGKVVGDIETRAA